MIDEQVLQKTQEIADYQFVDLNLLMTALTHASLTENRVASNERMEFLGDSVLGLVVCQELFRRLPDALEGTLTKIKSYVVARKTCAIISDEIGLSDLVAVGKGIRMRAGVPSSIRAAAYESLVGAIYLDGGLEQVERFILRTAETHIDQAVQSVDHENYKSVLQQIAQRSFAATPRYESLDEQGPDHHKSFEICVVIGDQRYPSAWGASKKQAEQKAAKLALKMLMSEMAVS